MEPDGSFHRGSRGRAVWSALLSLWAPGLGQVHAQAWRLGVVLLAALLAEEVVVLGLTHVDPGPVAVGVVAAIFVGVTLFRVWAAVDAAVRTRRAGGAAARPWYRSTWFTFVAYMAVSLGIVEAAPIGWRAFNVPAGSMLPTLRVGDYVMADVRPRAGLPSRGDVIVFLLPRDGTTIYLKRVVGLPGETVQFMHGRLTINGQEVERHPIEGGRTKDGGQAYLETLPGSAAPYTIPILQLRDDGPLDDTDEFHVPQDALFVLGDNRDNSLDSRRPEVGFVPARSVIGRIRTIYWSADRDRIGTLVR